MGASYWRVTVPLESTVEHAFDEARQDVFRTKDYVGASSDHKSIEEAVEAAEAEGTHSILDLERVLVGEPPPANVSPEQQLLIAAGMASGELHSHKAYEAPENVLRDACGARKPTRAEFDRSEDSVAARLKKRGLGFYVLLHNEPGQPVEVAFFGWTGD